VCSLNEKFGNHFQKKKIVLQVYYFSSNYSSNQLLFRMCNWLLFSYCNSNWNQVLSQTCNDTCMYLSTFYGLLQKSVWWPLSTRENIQIPYLNISVARIFELTRAGLGVVTDWDEDRDVGEGGVTVAAGCRQFDGVLKNSGS